MNYSRPLRVAVVGAGAFGRNHIRVWRQLALPEGAIHLAAVVEPDEARAAAVAAEYQVPVYPSVQQLLSAQSPPDAASITVPTACHAAVAAELLSAGVDILVEKPFTTTLEDADALIELAHRLGRLIQVGHLERFNPAVLAVRPLLNGPLFFEAHRLSVFTPRSLDVDVVLDLMVHDLDVVLSFVSSPVREVRAVGLPVLSSKVDIANARVEFDSGCIANFTASRVSTERVRKLRFFQPHQYISIDYARQDVLIIDVSGRKGPGMAPSVHLLPMAAQHPTPELGLHKLDVLPGEPLRLELGSFADCVRQRKRPLVSAEEGRAVLALALDILAAIHAHQDRTHLQRVMEN